MNSKKTEGKRGSTHAVISLSINGRLLPAHARFLSSVHGLCVVMPVLHDYLSKMEKEETVGSVRHYWSVGLANSAD